MSDDQPQQSGSLPHIGVLTASGKDDLLARLQQATRNGQYSDVLRLAQLALEHPDVSANQKAKIQDQIPQWEQFHVYAQWISSLEGRVRQEPEAVLAELSEKPSPATLSRVLYDRLARLKDKARTSRKIADAEAEYRPMLKGFEERMLRGDFASVMVELDRLQLDETLPEHIADEVRDMSRRVRLVYMDVQKKAVEQRLEDVREHLANERVQQAEAALQSIAQTVEKEPSLAELADRLHGLQAELTLKANAVGLDPTSTFQVRSDEEVNRVFSPPPEPEPAPARANVKRTWLLVGGMTLAAVVAFAALYLFGANRQGDAALATEILAARQLVEAALSGTDPQARSSLADSADPQIKASFEWLDHEVSPTVVGWPLPLGRDSDGVSLSGQAELAKNVNDEPWREAVPVRLVRTAANGWRLDAQALSETAEHSRWRERVRLAAGRGADVSAIREALASRLTQQLADHIQAGEVARHLERVWTLDATIRTENGDAGNASYLLTYVPTSHLPDGLVVRPIRVRASVALMDATRLVQLSPFDADVADAEATLTAWRLTQAERVGESVAATLTRDVPPSAAWRWLVVDQRALAADEIDVVVRASFASQTVNIPARYAPGELRFAPAVSAALQAALSTLASRGPATLDVEAALAQLKAKPLPLTALPLDGSAFPELVGALQSFKLAEVTAEPGDAMPRTVVQTFTLGSAEPISLQVTSRMWNGLDVEPVPLSADVLQAAEAQLTTRRQAERERALDRVRALAERALADAGRGETAVSLSGDTVQVSRGQLTRAVPLRWTPGELAYRLPAQNQLNDTFSSMADELRRARVSLTGLLDARADGKRFAEVLSQRANVALAAARLTALGDLPQDAKLVGIPKPAERKDGSGMLSFPVQFDFASKQAAALSATWSLEVPAATLSAAYRLAIDGNLSGAVDVLGPVLNDHRALAALETELKKRAADWRLAGPVALVRGSATAASPGARLAALLSRFGRDELLDELGGEEPLAAAVKTLDFTDVHLRDEAGQRVLSGRLRVGFASVEPAGMPLTFIASQSGDVALAPTSLVSRGGAEGLEQNLIQPVRRGGVSVASSGDERADVERDLIASANNKTAAELRPSDARDFLVAIARVKFPGRANDFNALLNADAAAVLAAIYQGPKTASPDTYATHMVELFFGRQFVHAMYWQVADPANAAASVQYARSATAANIWASRIGTDSAQLGALLAELKLTQSPAFTLAGDRDRRFGLLIAVDLPIAALGVDQAAVPGGWRVDHVGIGVNGTRTGPVSAAQLAELFTLPDRGRDWAENGRLVSLWVTPTLTAAQLQTALTPADAQENLRTTRQLFGIQADLEVLASRPSAVSGWPAVVGDATRRTGQFLIVQQPGRSGTVSIPTRPRGVAGELFHPNNPAVWFYQLLNTASGRSAVARPVWVKP